jgi:hypothetical protein
MWFSWKNKRIEQDDIFIRSNQLLYNVARCWNDIYFQACESVLLANAAAPLQAFANV